jgi:hypothetical protein
MREAKRCTAVTNAVLGEADGAAVLAERALPLMAAKVKPSGSVGERMSKLQGHGSRSYEEGDWQLVIKAPGITRMTSK